MRGPVPPSMASTSSLGFRVSQKARHRSSMMLKKDIAGAGKRLKDHTMR